MTALTSRRVIVTACCLLCSNTFNAFQLVRLACQDQRPCKCTCSLLASGEPHQTDNLQDGEVELHPPFHQQPDPFLVDITKGEPTERELHESNLVKIVRSECTDHEVNLLAWKCLGYRYKPNEGNWDNLAVFPKWRERYPEPPDLIGVTRQYSKEVDAPVRRANSALVRSVPATYKQSLKATLAPYGFKGFKIAELTPNRTRRAQVCNWLCYFKLELWGIPLEELTRRKAEAIQGPRGGETPEQLGQKMVY